MKVEGEKQENERRMRGLHGFCEETVCFNNSS